MNNLHIITPVKDSIESTLQTLRAICASDLPGAAHSLTVYNDFSTPENTARLAAAAKEMGFTLVNLADLTDHPSPNYLLVLQTASRKALDAGADLIIVESDVTVAPDTLRRLHEAADARPDCGIMAAVTVDDQGAVNYPYLYAKGYAKGIAPCKKHCSFCCSLLSHELLRRFDFGSLNPEKNWYDVTISHAAPALGLQNYLATDIPVVHRPHQSRPWKQLKYTNPLKYYWKKFTKGLDKI